MQKIGDVCDSCRERWETQGKEPKVLVHVNRTIQKSLPVPVCTYCDGDEIVKVYALKNHE